MPGPRASERDFLLRVRERLPAAGDDLAVLDLPPGAKLLAGVDPALDGVHFRLGGCGPHLAGGKAARRNLSDVAAMGGTPAGLLLSLACPRDLSADDAWAILEGVDEAAGAEGCRLVGGDFAVWDGPLAITVAVVGHAAAPVPRHGARPGQALFVTGPLGGSILGRHLTQRPRVAEGQRLAASSAAIGLSAMCDVSDGLAADLPRLLDGLGATIDLRKLPVHDDARRLAETTGRAPVDHALGDGEDYELLLAADVSPADVACVEIGVVEEGPVVRLRDADGVRPMPAGGFLHGGGDVTDSPEATRAVAAVVAGRLRDGGVLRLEGELGAGKTTFVRGLVAALGGDAGDVSSPTYVLHQPYPIAGGRTLHHLDAYRVSGEADFEAIGFDELLSATAEGDVVVVEWPGRVEGVLPASSVTVRLEHLGDSRRRVTVLGAQA